MKHILIILLFSLLLSCQQGESTSSFVFPTPSPPIPESPPSEKPPKDSNEEATDISSGASEDKAIEKKKTLIINIEIQNTYKKLRNIFISEAYAADQPYCNDSCSSEKCLYLIEIDANGSEYPICSKDISLNDQNAFFELKNPDLLEGKTLEVRTYENIEEVDISQQRANSFRLSQDDLEKETKHVLINRTEFQLSFFKKARAEKHDQLTPLFITQESYNIFQIDQSLENYEAEDLDILITEIIIPNLDRYDFISHYMEALLNSDAYSVSIIKKALGAKGKDKIKGYLKDKRNKKEKNNKSTPNQKGNRK